MSAAAANPSGVLITSQNLDEIERLADRVVVLDEGTVIADGPAEALQHRIGGQVIDVGLDGAGLAVAAHSLGTAGFDAHMDRGARRVTTPTSGGRRAAAEAANALIRTGVEPNRFALRSPSLEEAFLALTGGTPGSADRDVGVHADLHPLPEPIRPVTTRSARRDIAVLVGRDWKRLRCTPESLFFAAVMPIMFVLGLAAVFGDLVEGVLGDDYIQFLLPGVLVMQIVLAAGATGVGLATDLRDGIIDRFRSLPMAQVAVLTCRAPGCPSRP